MPRLEEMAEVLDAIKALHQLKNKTNFVRRLSGDFHAFGKLEAIGGRDLCQSVLCS